MVHSHAVVWLDRSTARIIGCDASESIDVEAISSRTPEPGLHRTSGRTASGHARFDLEYFDRVADALREVEEVLIVGPAHTKFAFESHLDERHPDIARHVVGVETVGYQSDPELAAFGKQLFTHIDALGDDPDR